MLVVAALAFASRVAPDLLGGQERELAADLPQSLGRLSYPIGYWNALAALMAAAVVLLTWLAAYGRALVARSVAVAALPLPLLVIYLTQSRGGAVAAAVGWAIVFAGASRRVRVRALAGGAIGAAGGAALILLATGRDAFRSPVVNPDGGTEGIEMVAALLIVSSLAFLVAFRSDELLAAARLPALRIPRLVAVGAAVVLVAGIGAATAASGAIDEFSDPEGFLGRPDDRASLAGSGRSQFWSVALDAFAEAPAGGIGAGNYELFWNGNEPIPVALEHAHSLYLETLAELGPLGFGLVVGFLALGAAAGVARRRRSSGGEVAAALALVATGALTAAIEWTWEVPAVFAPVVISVALLTGRATTRPTWPRPVDEDERRSVRDRLVTAAAPRERFGLGIATLLAGLACIWVAGVILLGSVQLSQSRAAVSRGDLEDAANNASFAESIEPWSSATSLQLAQVEELRGRLSEAAAWADESISESPGDWQGWFVAARIARRAGDDATADRALARAAELSPLPLPEPILQHD